MPIILVPLQVKIGLKGGNRHAYPDFASLAIVKLSGLDWSVYVDQFAGGWRCDSCCGHSKETPESPLGIQIGLLMVPISFAEQAAAAWPETCRILYAPEAEAFYNQHVGGQQPLYLIDQKTVAAVQARKTAGLVMSAEEAKALDPADPTIGIRFNKMRVFAGWKAENGFAVHPDFDKPRPPGL